KLLTKFSHGVGSEMLLLFSNPSTLLCIALSVLLVNPFSCSSILKKIPFLVLLFCSECVPPTRFHNKVFFLDLSNGGNKRCELSLLLTTLDNSFSMPLYF